MMSLKPGYKNPQIISVWSESEYLLCHGHLQLKFSQNISETISNIPLHIGVEDLKAVAYFTLLPLFIKWSKNHTLSIEDLRLRFKDWVELISQGPDDEDVNAITNKFFVPKGKSKVPQFQPNKVLDLFLEIGYETYSRVLEHLELQNEEVC